MFVHFVDIVRIVDLHCLNFITFHFHYRFLVDINKLKTNNITLKEQFKNRRKRQNRYP